MTSSRTTQSQWAVCNRLMCAALVTVAWTAPAKAGGQDLRAAAKIQQELGKPFCYFLVPSDVLGFKDCPEGTQVTYDGAFNTGFSEFDLFAGAPLAPVNERVKTLHNGYLPIVEYTFVRDGLVYKVQALGAPLDLDPRNVLINFIRVTVTNPSAEPARGGAAAEFVDRHGKARCDLGCQDWYRDRYMKADVFAKSGQVKADSGKAWRDEHLLYTYPENAWQKVGGHHHQVAYEISLEPGASQQFDFKVPYVPVHKSHGAVVEAIAAAGYDDYLARVEAFWEDQLRQAVQIDLPDPKVVNTMRSSIVYDLIARDISSDGKRYIQKVNEFQYDNFYPRDSAYIIRTYDLLGLHDIAGQTVEHFLTYDDQGRPNGLRRLMPDDWGQSLWAIGSHFRSTGDLNFAKRVYSAIPPHVAAFEAACQRDPLGLWPAAGLYDNEMINGHYTGHSFWALLGLREAINLARSLHKEDDAIAFTQLHDRYRERFMKRLNAVAAQAEGYIPPGLEDPAAGCDWANGSAGVYPFGVLKPHDPLVTATVQTIRDYKYREGIMTYGPNAWYVKERSRYMAPADPGWLHHYDTFYIAQTLLARGEQRKVIEDLYSVLAHTSATNAGFEFTIRPWGDRDPNGNYPPHGWFAARYNELLRNMLLREEDDDLHVASALSPVWIAPGKRVSVGKGATTFGTLSFDIDATASGAVVDFQARWRNPPRRLLFHVPWFVELTSAAADGQTINNDGRVVVVPPTVKKLELAWRWKEKPDLSYRRAVLHYLDKYYHRPPDADYCFLFPTPRPPRLRNEFGVFTESIDVDMYVPGGAGTIYYTTDDRPPDEKATRYTGPVHLTETTTLNAVAITDDGRRSGTTQVTLTKAAPRPPDNPARSAPGLRYQVYHGVWKTLPDFSAMDVISESTASTFSLDQVNVRDDHYGIVFSGYIRIPRDGAYRFFTASDDGSRLSIGSTRVVDNDGLHMWREESGVIALGEGLHAIQVTFFERDGAARLRVSYEGPGIEKQEIPAAAIARSE